MCLLVVHPARGGVNVERVGAGIVQDELVQLRGTCKRMKCETRREGGHAHAKGGRRVAAMSASPSALHGE